VPRFTVTGGGVSSTASDFAADVRTGLSATPKRLSCRWFYDREGSRLFEAICELPEYYLARSGREIMTAHREEVLASAPVGCSLLELGSGSSDKTAILIDDLLRRDGSLLYTAIDISRPALEDAGRALAARFPGLEFRGIAEEYEEGLRSLGRGRDRGPRLFLWLGSSIGNLDREQAWRFLEDVRRHFGARDRFLIGIDLRKDRGTLVSAYDDAKGVTARFNLNLLARINRELGGAFDLDAFRHVATYDDDLGRIQMHLASRCAQTVAIRALGASFRFDDGELIHTEDSYKYSLGEIEELGAASGFRVARQWLDAARWFSLSLFDPR
jgi:dimethylhistidine N-methyltransferase